MAGPGREGGHGCSILGHSVPHPAAAGEYRIHRSAKDDRWVRGSPEAPHRFNEILLELLPPEGLQPGQHCGLIRSLGHAEDPVPLLHDPDEPAVGDFREENRSSVVIQGFPGSG